MDEFLHNDQVPEAIRRCAAIDNELESLGAYKLLDERMELKDLLKEYLKTAIKISTPATIKGEADAYDEISGWEAVVRERTKDEWDLEKLRGELSNKQKTRYITLHADKDAIKEGIKIGDLSRAKLESVGAVKKVPHSFALHVRERKTDA